MNRIQIKGLRNSRELAIKSELQLTATRIPTFRLGDNLKLVISDRSIKLQSKKIEASVYQ